MIRALFLFVILGIGLYVGAQYSGQQGYVLISVAHKTIEMSVTTLIVIIIALLAILFGLEYLFKKCFKLSYNTWHWFGTRKLKKSRRYTNEGILSLLEGDWKLAEKKVTALAKNHDMPLLCYLIASEAALEQGNKEKRDHYLSLASKQDNSTLAVGLTKAKQYAREGQYDIVQKLITEIAVQYPDNPIVLKLQKQAYIHLQKWDSLLELLPKLKKQKLLDEPSFNQLHLQAHSQLLAQMAKTRGRDGLLGYWQQLTKKIKTQPGIVQNYVRLLIKHHASEEAFSIIKSNLKKNPTSTIFYGQLTELELNDDQPVIQLLRNMIHQNPHHAEANSALGHIYFRKQQWQHAQICFERALKERSSISDYQHLAQTLEHQNMDQAAHDVSKKALSLVNGQ
jgi:HemY protein